VLALLTRAQLAQFREKFTPGSSSRRRRRRRRSDGGGGGGGNQGQQQWQQWLKVWMERPR
jgi:hypothetical protein